MMLLILLVLVNLYSIVAQSLTDSGTSTEIRSSCGENQCWCEPGWLTPDCKKPLLKNGDCECYPDKPDDRSFLKNTTWVHPRGYRCEALCKWNADVGVPRAPYTEWKDNQVWRQLSFYQKDLPKTVKTPNTHLKARLDEFDEGYKKFTYLNGLNFGDVIELGCGGYTQTRNVMERINATIKSVTLVDPQLNVYKNIAGCSYASGSLLNLNTTMFSKTTEEIAEQLKSESFDTVIHMNVLVYVRDAFKYLETMYRILKPGGMLLFHERWFDNPVVSSTCKTAGFDINIVQVTKKLLDHFLSFFDREPYYSLEQTKYMVSRSKEWCNWRDDETAFFVAVRKKKDAPKFTSLYKEN